MFLELNYNMILLRILPKTIFRYLASELTSLMISVTTIIVVIFLSNQLIRLLNFVASGRYPASLLLQLVFLQVPILFGYLLPLGLFVALLLALGRWYAESEMTVMMACGLSRKQLLAMVLGYAFFIMLIVSLLVFWVSPLVAQKRDQILDQAQSASMLQTIVPGQFQVSKDSKRVFYVETLTRDRKNANNVFVASQEDEKGTSKKPDGTQDWLVLSAQDASTWLDSTSGQQYLVTKKGFRYLGSPGKENYQVAQFGEYGMRIDTPSLTGQNEGDEVLSTASLLRLAWHHANDMAELQWRLSMPLSVLILALLAVPLSRVRPRQGRFARLLPAIFIYILYANFMFLSRLWIENQVIPAWIGIIWVHFIALCLALLLLAWFFDKHPLRFLLRGEYKYQ